MKTFHRAWYSLVLWWLDSIDLAIFDLMRSVAGALYDGRDECLPGLARGLVYTYGCFCFIASLCSVIWLYIAMNGLDYKNANSCTALLLIKLTNISCVRHLFLL